jgi:hypothetical protein
MPAAVIKKHLTNSWLKFLFHDTNTENQEIQRIINYANGIYFSLMYVFKSQNVHKKTKIRIYKTIIKPALMYGCETWSLLQNAENKLGAFKKKFLRRIYGPINENGQWRCRYNTELYELYKYEYSDIVNDVKPRRLQWAGHVIRMPEEWIPRKVMMGRLEGVRPMGRPRKRWMDGVWIDAKELLKVKNWKALALDRNEWRHIIGKAKARFGL